jgi:hypothetical protein
MSPRPPRYLFAALFLAAVGCASATLVPDAQRPAIQNELVNHARYLRVAFYVTPFFSDEGNWLITDVAPDQLDLIDRPDGTPVNPGKPVKILAPGQRVRVEQVEFATSLTIATRPLYTPRYNPWIYLRLVDDPVGSKPYILVLRPDLHNEVEFLEEVGRYLSPFPPDTEGFPPEVTKAIAGKTVRLGMTPTQVEMAWGYPERIVMDSPNTTQTWTWPMAKQRAWFASGALVGWTDHGALGGTLGPTPSEHEH